MALRVVGAGLGRTGTRSLKDALEHLLGAPCYHMMEVFGRPQDPPVWTRALSGEPVDFGDLLEGYAAIVDWPGAGCWRDLAAAFPDAVVLLSTRDSPETWYRSASDTIFSAMGPVEDNDDDWSVMAATMMRRFEPDWQDPAAAMAAYERHNAAVRAEALPDRLVEWQPGDGWAPLCRALGLAEPDEPFPHLNTTEQFRSGLGL
jgi:hypothetical protein